MNKHIKMIDEIIDELTKEYEAYPCKNNFYTLAKAIRTKKDLYQIIQMEKGIIL